MIASELSYYPTIDNEAIRRAEHARLRDDTVGDLGRIAVLAMSAGIAESHHSHEIEMPLHTPEVEPVVAEQPRSLGNLALENYVINPELTTSPRTTQLAEALRAQEEALHYRAAYELAV